MNIPICILNGEIVPTQNYPQLKKTDDVYLCNIDGYYRNYRYGYEVNEVTYSHRASSLNKTRKFDLKLEKLQSVGIDISVLEYKHHVGKGRIAEWVQLIRDELVKRRYKI